MNDFYDWLAAYRKERSAIGDLARDVAEDGVWPDEENNPQILHEYLEETGASDEVLSTFEAAYEHYSGQPFPEDDDNDGINETLTAD